MKSGNIERRFSLLSLVTCLSLVLTGLLVVVPSALGLVPGEPAPAFSVRNLQGAEVTLSQFKGKVVYLDFWATWCAPCRMTLPWMHELQQKYSSKGLVVLAVNEDNDLKQMEKVVSEIKPAFTPLFDAGGEIAGKFEPPTMPTSYLIDRSGNIQRVFRGFHEGEGAAIEQQIAAALAGTKG